MSNPFDADEYGAPLLPGGVPELAGTGPHGSYPNGSPTPGVGGDPVVESVEGEENAEAEHNPDEADRHFVTNPGDGDESVSV